MKLSFSTTLLFTTLSLFFVSLVDSLPILESLGVIDKSFNGDGTYYAVGLGSCGNTNTDDELVVAMNPSWMSSQEMCGQKIKATGPNGSVTVTVVDKCPGCGQNDLDFSAAAFDQIGDQENGRISISWKFI